MSKSAALLVLVLIVASYMVTFGPVAAESPPGFIRIAADGSVIGTNLILRNGNVYTFAGNISGGIAVEKDNIVIDGASYTLQGPGKDDPGGGLILEWRRNVVVKNLHITAYMLGIGVQFWDCIFEGNNITDCTIGVHLGVPYGNNTFIGNIFTSSVGFTYGGGGNYFYGNNFIDGGHAHDAFAGGDNTFDGNYWEVLDAENWIWVAYNGTDANGDGIGDTPYVVYNDNIDKHPLMKPASNQWRTVPPIISVISPENETYVAANVSLAFAVDRPVVWTGYSLDGQETVTITGNTTIANLSNGLHNVTVYANDPLRNMGTSETITFTVDVPEPFPVLPVAAASVAAVVVTGAGLLVYLRKRRREARQA